VSYQTVHLFAPDGAQVRARGAQTNEPIRAPLTSAEAILCLRAIQEN